MNRYQSARVTFVPKPTKYLAQSKVEPVRSQLRCEDTVTSSPLSSHIHPWTISMNSFQQPLTTTKSMKRLIENKTHRSKEFLSNSSTSFDVIQQTMKNTSK
ncbi:unnamed protein product [Rotaria sordida]|uniref:Uncharacterized protein n=1 Tax=Rotaria sordida TaxID=392033 RepID=A0A819T009_9BILA|nr:unnamed protein product [Rotaria sordida]CAF4069477.1 unnamed protein product [Rotaria sordida]